MSEEEEEIPVTNPPVNNPPVNDPPSNPEGPRRSARQPQPRKLFCSCCNRSTADLHDLKPVTKDPVTVKEALSGPCALKWKEAMNEEISKLLDMETWIIVPRPSMKTVVDNKWVFRTKLNQYGEIVDRRARLVARGFSLTPGVDFETYTYAPVIRKSSIRLLIAIAVEKGWNAEQLDVKSAYLNSYLEEAVFMEQPQGCEVSDPQDFVCKLQKSMYGLPQKCQELE